MKAPIRERFAEVVARLIPAGRRLLVGYSGGCDSTCLLHLLSSLDLFIVAAHLHHGQRAEADGELKLCEEFARGMDTPFVSGRADVPRMAKELGIGLEEAGRRARYEFFRKAAFELGCDLIATAHTRTDLVETVLINLARGTGLAGLAGIPERRDNIVRPLIEFSREETRTYCEEHRFWFHDDPANEDPRFARSRLRHRVMPEFREVNPDAEEAIARLAGFVREEDGFLNGLAAAALERAETPLNGDLRFLTEDVEMCFGRSALAALPAVLFRRAVRLAVDALGGALDSHQTRLIEAGIAEGCDGSVTAVKGEVVIEWTPDKVHVRRLSSVSPYRCLLTLPGETISDEFGWRFVAIAEGYEELDRHSDRGEEQAERGTSANPGRRRAKIPRFARNDEVVASQVVVPIGGREDRTEPQRADNPRPSRAAMDVHVAGTVGQIYFRSPNPGDKMQPLGFDGHRKLSDLMSEAGLTLAARARLPVVCDMVGPFWAPGICLDERVRPGNRQPRAIRIRFEKLEVKG